MQTIKKILISQPRPSSEKSPYFALEKRYGVQFDFKQLIQVVGLSAREFRLQHINLLNYTAFMFTSRTGIDHFFRLCEELRVIVPEETHYFCSSELIGNYLQKYIQYRKRRVFCGIGNKFDEVVPIAERQQEKCLLVCSDVHNDDIVNLFAASGVAIDTCIMYRTCPVKIPSKELRQYNMAVLFTPTGVNALKHNCSDYCAAGRVVACFGSATAAAIREVGWTPAIVAPTKETPSITAAIEKYLMQRLKEEEQAQAKKTANVRTKDKKK